MFKNKTLLITGGTGSFGNAVLKHFLKTDIKEIRIFSRDEKKQEDMRLKEVLEVIPVGRSTWWLWVAQGKAPAPIKLGERVTYWHSADIEAFIDGMEVSS